LYLCCGVAVDIIYRMTYWLTILTKLATKTYPKIPKRFIFAVSVWLIFGMLWVSLPVKITPAPDYFAVESIDLLIALVVVFQIKHLINKHVIMVGECNAHL